MAKKRQNNNNSKFSSDVVGNLFNNVKKDTHSNSSKLSKKSNAKNNQNSKSKDQTKKVSSKKTNSKNAKQSKSKDNSKKDNNKPKTITNKYGVIPMSCTLDIRTIGKLDSAKQVLGVHNRNAVVDLLIHGELGDLIDSPKAKKEYKMYYKVFMMKHKKQAEHHYKQFYKNGEKNS